MTHAEFDALDWRDALRIEGFLAGEVEGQKAAQKKAPKARRRR